LTTRHGKAVMALQGAHLLSWILADQQDVFWLSPASLPEPAAIRGGVPVCWPWFAKQGQASTAMQHGPVRNLLWQVSAIHACSDDEISLTLQPILPPANRLAAAGIPAGLHVSLRITLGQTLSQTLQTHNHGNGPFELSQALHSYYAVSHAQRVEIEGLHGLTYTDRLRDLTQGVQRTPFVLGNACDRTYAHSLDVPAQRNHRYTLVDAAWQRRIVIDVEGSRSVVVWNPGQEAARNIVDVPEDKWPDFMCIEATNAGPDVIHLQPGASHALSQHVKSELAC
jgi:glucose-6-phosphate 1-epimerase